MSKTEITPDFDLVTHIGNTLRRFQFTEDQIYTFLNDPFIRDVTFAPSDVQKHIVSQFFAGQVLSYVDNPDREIRICLSPLGDVDEWIEIFINRVIPYLKEHNLPRVRNSHG
jgi:hypothetical protein